MPSLTLPYNYQPREYQQGFWRAFDSGKRRILSIWHRRAGKDKSFINLCARESQQRVGTYFYFLPTYAQGKKIIWDGMDKDGFKFLDHFPEALIAGKNNTEMKLTLKNGSIFQVVGSDSIDSIVGTNPIGCVFSEFALQDPTGWNLVRPILRENGGWAAFNGTPRGKNHMYKLYNLARTHPEWYVEKLSVDDTGIVSEADIEMERASGMPEETIQQEFYCSFEGGMRGAYYAQLLEDAENHGRIKSIPYEPALPVDTWWDLGVGDATAIVFSQTLRAGEIRIIDYYEMSGEGLPHYAKVLQNKPYIYGEHVAPHDINVRDLSTGRSRLEAARDLGISFKVAPKLPIEDGINAVRMMLPICWFDAEKTVRLRDALMTYRKEYDLKYDIFKDRPVHDWSSHAADAMRTGAVGRKRARVEAPADRYRRAESRTYGGSQRRSWLAM